MTIRRTLSEELLNALMSICAEHNDLISDTNYIIKKVSESTDFLGKIL